MEGTIEELLKKAQEGDEDSLKKVVEYYKNDGDEEMADYFEKKLKDASSSKNDVEEISVESSEAVKAESVNEEEKNKKKEFSYADLNTAELKEKAENNDPEAYYELANRYYRDNQFEKCMDLLNSAIEILKENSENCTEKELECLFHCYNLQNHCYDKEDLENQFLAMQNAAEVPCNEKLKESVYYRLALLYGFYKHDFQACEKYLTKAGSLSKKMCIQVANIYLSRGNNVDYEDWLERAEKMASDDRSEDQILSSIIEFKKKYHNGNELTPDDYVDLINKNFVEKKCFDDLGNYFGVEERKSIVNEISNVCSKYNENEEYKNSYCDLYNVCNFLLNDKKYNPNYYENINCSKIDNFRVKLFLAEIEKDNIYFPISDKLYNDYREALIKNERIGALNKMKEQEEVKNSPELEKMIVSDIEKVNSNIKNRLEQEEYKKKCEEEKRRKEEEEQRQREEEQRQREEEKRKQEELIRLREERFKKEEASAKRITAFVVVAVLGISVCYAIVDSIMESGIFGLPILLAIIFVAYKFIKNAQNKNKNQ